MTTKTNEEYLSEFSMFVPEDDGSATDWLKNLLEAKDQQIAEAVKAERERVLQMTRGHGKGCDERYHAECIEMIQEEIQAPTKTDKQ